jgi:hypothetical protein
MRARSPRSYHHPRSFAVSLRSPTFRPGPAIATLAVLAGTTFSPQPARAAAGAAQAAADHAALSQLAGTYRSSAAEDWGRGSYGTREFGFNEGRWSLRFTLALDPQMRSKVFEFRTQGHYVVGAASKTVPGAFDALFTEDAKYVTLHTSDPQLAAAFGLAACGLQPGVESDISVAGCAVWKPVAVCREDHDLLALDAQGGLRFGVRPPDNDMCSAQKRPTALLPAVVKR